MKLLCVDSSSETASVAVIEDNKILTELTYNDKKQHSVILMTLIDSAIKNSGNTISDIDGFVVSKGPGSFTGLRIGMSTVKALAHGSNKPYASISTLDALAYSIPEFNGIICPLFDALRNNVYTALYKKTNGELLPICDYDAIEISELINKLNSLGEPVLFLGDDCFKFKDMLSEVKLGTFASPFNNLVRASSLGFIAMDKFKNNDFNNLDEDAPLYIRVSQAEREYINKHGKTVYEE
ncbi:peptidase M22 glycoprotease [Clostridium bornimense]|uniref:Peptidase M22 glycoprotease n=1 Tax=Clostridium bornimense TaxID=1216932 RepID=W6S512_9CLOT|nr:tRNA (adenosine(37)-N6)-threonylcarbamoyltransferase complex dimerization subunit type 1 TsaB [Clostridium bornimense]CDM69397.1 peptidase M22 glycoprotease [Clostridium bornimense]